MSKKTYPRIGRTIKLLPHVKKNCEICGAPATHKCDIEYTYMRGDDDTEHRCEAHSKDVAYTFERKV